MRKSRVLYVGCLRGRAVGTVEQGSHQEGGRSLQELCGYGTSAWCLLTSEVTSAQGHESQEAGKLTTSRHEVMARVNSSRDREYKKGQALNDSIIATLLQPCNGKGPIYSQGLEPRNP